jgi:hypothetical protein
MDDEYCAKPIPFDNMSIYRSTALLLNRNESCIDVFVKRWRVKVLMDVDEKKVWSESTKHSINVFIEERDQITV